MAIPSARANGTLAYSGWKLDGEQSKDNGLDFALIEVHPSFRASVHPSVQGWGGPEGLATPQDIGTGSKVLYYGNSDVRADQDSIKQREGYVFQERGGSGFDMSAVTPGVPGDSGSGIMTGDGQALGVLSTIELSPRAGSNSVSLLQPALSYAEEHAGLQVELVTWELLDDGRLP